MFPKYTNYGTKVVQCPGGVDWSAETNFSVYGEIWASSASRLRVVNAAWTQG